MDKDYVTPEERVYPAQGKYPVVLAIIALLFLAYGIADAVTQWGERPVVEFRIPRSCGF